MKPFAEIALLPLGVLLRLTGFLLLCAAMWIAFLSVRRKGVRLLPLCCSEVLLLLLICFVLLDGTSVYDWRTAPYVRTHWPRVVTAVYALPWLTILLGEALLTAWLAVRFLIESIALQRHVSQDTVKKTMDLFPAGFCFSDADGVVRHANLQMNRFAYAVMEKRLTDANELWDAVQAYGEESGEKRLFVTHDGAALLFGQSRIDIQGERFQQITAVDVTERYRVTALLKERHQKLQDLSLAMKAWSAVASEYAMKQEILTARISVHDEVGHVLLRGRYYLEHPGNTDEAALLSLLWQTNRTLLHEAEQPDDADPVAFAMRTASMIGVRVTVDGALPDQYRDLLGQVIRECAANAFKHAEADAMTVSIDRALDRIAVSVTNNGHAPADPVRESGGLRSIRAAVERANGMMSVESEPVFRLLLWLNP